MQRRARSSLVHPISEIQYGCTITVLVRIHRRVWDRPIRQRLQDLQCPPRQLWRLPDGLRSRRSLPSLVVRKFESSTIKRGLLAKKPRSGCSSKANHHIWRHFGAYCPISTGAWNRRFGARRRSLSSAGIHGIVSMVRCRRRPGKRSG